ncbi:MAG: Transcriptional regulatory protein YycF [Firmicutes bacterium ADurb.Bin419]|nr:MAG: Transcriptional regulatory protein YycF [Firmicutes bacterium ADurb.Bin419]
MKKILVVDDENSVRDLIQLILKRENYEVITAVDGNSALETLKTIRPDLIILDLMLPDMSGYDVCKVIFRDYKIPIIMLTAKNEVFDKVLGFECGADDYITKPFESIEFIARVKAVLRRHNGSSSAEEVVECNDLKIDLTNMVITKNGEDISVTQKEFQLLELFARNPRKVFSREDLLQKIWGYDYFGDSRVVDTCITRLRKKIEDDSTDPKYIITVFGLGYRFGGKG